MRSATVTATLWFLIGVAAALSVTSLAIVTIPIAVVLTVVVLRKGLHDRWLWSAAPIGAAVVLLYFGIRQWASPAAPAGTATSARRRSDRVNDPSRGAAGCPRLRCSS
jgi:hypothetical protein